MGNYCGGKKEVKLVLIGLDVAGKTSILHKLCRHEIGSTAPTIGFSIDSTVYKHMKISIWDIGGQDKIRDLWKHYYEEVDGILYAVDSTDPERFEESREALHKALHDINLQNAFLCVLANKCDLADQCVSLDEIKSRLQLESVSDSRPWTLLEVSALQGTGLDKLLEWVSKQKIRKR